MRLGHLELTSRLKSERGQMAIFIALIFQVLFVFFAMIVNVGLIVHDKINLQNSVDLAAYYAAQKQAEMLNAIAHQNYQLRQAWKLLSFRVRVLGDLGYAEHPMQPDSRNNYPDVSAFQGGVTAGGSLKTNWLPTICVNHAVWGVPQNLCYKSNIEIPEIPTFRSINPFDINRILTQNTINMRKDMAGADCKATGPMNFKLGVIWMAAYRNQVAKSKNVIRIYADRLSQDPGEFFDIQNNSVKMGAVKTLKYNLTRANFESLDNQGFRIYNSLGALGKREEWLNEIPIYPTLFYTDLFNDVGNGCSGARKNLGGTKNINRPRHDSAPNNDDDFARNEPPRVSSLYHSIIGVEKNPWAMAYVGVYAETRPRKPYLPFGEPIVLKAKAFAKPFGGRIGPWYYKTWPEGQNRSQGNIELRTDRLLPIPLDPEGNIQAATTSELELSVPNYSRFPGDPWGLLSRAALATFKETVFRKVIGNDYIKTNFYSGALENGDGLAMVSQQAGGADMRNLPLLGYPGPWIREIEVAAVAPDLFDTTYYSVDPNAFENYTQKSLRYYFQQEDAPLDFGSKGFGFRKNIKNQIEIASSLASKNSALNFWLIKQPSHLLTGWSPSGAYTYDFPEETFGRCYDENNQLKHAVPGMCVRGGRVGYSVKIISEDYLKSEQLPLGGQRSRGRIKNPPPENF